MRVRDEMSAAIDRATKSVSKLDTDLGGVTRESDKTSTSFDRLAREANDASQASSGFSVKLAALGNIAGDLAMRALSAVGAAVSDVASAMINGNAEFERYETQFGVLIGGSEKAKQRLAELAEFGAKTPFELPEVVRADKVLQGFGLHSEDAAKKFGFSGKQIRTIAGDLAAGTGQNFEDMARYLGMFASGATGEAISRFQELGITTREELAKMGLEFSKSGELTTPTQQAFTTLLQVAQNKFGGMMNAQSKTFEGMISNLNDWKGNTLRAIGEPIFEVLRDKLGAVLEFLGSDQVKNAISDFARGMAATLKTVVDWLDRNWPTIQKTVTDVFSAVRYAYDTILRPTVDFIISLFERLLDNTRKDFGAMQSSINAVMSGIEELIDAVLSTIVDLWQRYGEDIVSFVSETWDTVSEIVNTAIAVVVRVIEIAMPEIKRIVNDAMDTLKIAFSTAWAAIQIVVGTVLDTVLGLLRGTMQLLNGDAEGALNTLRETFSRIWNRIYEVVGSWLGDIKAVIDDRMRSSGTSVDQIMNGIFNAISSTWTSAYNTVDYWVGTIRNRTSATFQEMRDDVTLSFNVMTNNIIASLRNALNFYNQIAPFLGYPVIPTGGFGAMSRGAQADGGSGGVTFNLTANYTNQPERSIRDDVQMLQMLYRSA